VFLVPADESVDLRLKVVLEVVYAKTSFPVTLGSDPTVCRVSILGVTRCVCVLLSVFEMCGVLGCECILTILCACTGETAVGVREGARGP